MTQNLQQLPVHPQKKLKKIVLPSSKVVDQDSKPRYLTIDDIQRDFLPISKKRIRKIVNEHIHTIRVGNKILVDRNHLENFLENPPTSQI